MKNDARCGHTPRTCNVSVVFSLLVAITLCYRPRCLMMASVTDLGGVQARELEVVGGLAV